MEILKIDNVSLIYQTNEAETQALQNVNLSIEDGEFVAIIGQIGCGKTTILTLISGLMKTTSGAIYLDVKIIDKHVV